MMSMRGGWRSFIRIWGRKAKDGVGKNAYAAVGWTVKRHECRAPVRVRMRPCLVNDFAFGMNL